MTIFELISIIIAAISLIISLISFSFSVITFKKEKPQIKIKILKFEKLLYGDLFFKLNIANLSLKDISIRNIYLKLNNSNFSQIAQYNNEDITDICIPYYQTITLNCYFLKNKNLNNQKLKLIIDTPLKIFKFKIKVKPEI